MKALRLPRDGDEKNPSLKSNEETMTNPRLPYLTIKKNLAVRVPVLVLIQFKISTVAIVDNDIALSTHGEGISPGKSNTVHRYSAKTKEIMAMEQGLTSRIQTQAKRKPDASP